MTPSSFARGPCFQGSLAVYLAAYARVDKRLAMKKYARNDKYFLMTLAMARPVA